MSHQLARAAFGGDSAGSLVDDLDAQVRDAGSPEPDSTVPLDDPLQVHGRGLQLVDSLVARWGSERDSAGTTVWFVLES